ncbi:MAG: YlmC/YmxH family sporulation protein [Oscillospiraceae bacterium]|nr:YlmC/YmxH family sporulation protein [Oscillospiraceae bacterium]
MSCTAYDLRAKEIINLNTGHRLGFVYDVEITLPDGQVTALIVPGPARFFGLLGKGEDLIILWDQVTKVGEEIILVDMETAPRRQRQERRRWFP